MDDMYRFHSFSMRSPSVNITENCWFAHFRVNMDFSGLFPYIRAVGDEAIHYDSPEHVVFKMGSISCSLYPPDTVVSRPFYGRDQALEFAQKLIAFFNDIDRRKSEIPPTYEKVRRLHVPEILSFLPMTNCRECGFQTCMAFAGAVSRRKAKLTACPHFPRPAGAEILYVVKARGSEKVMRIAVDPGLAGVAISRVDEDRTSISQQRSLNKRKRRSPGLLGNRDGVVFKLSGRETEVLRLIAEGFTNKEIAGILNVSHYTVKSHVIHIFNKLGIGDRTQAAVWAAQNDLI